MRRNVKRKRISTLGSAALSEHDVSANEIGRCPTYDTSPGNGRLKVCGRIPWDAPGRVSLPRHGPKSQAFLTTLLTKLTHPNMEIQHEVSVFISYLALYAVPTVPEQ